jgi:hypothetical protein
MVGWNDLDHTIIRLLQLCAARAEKVNKLFGIIAAAARPETTPDATGQYQTIVVVVCHD